MDESQGSVRASPDGRFLVEPDGSPFFWLGDTAWAMFMRLDREDITYYLRDRADKGFNIVQAVAIGGPFDGLDVPNRYGELALIDKDPARPNPRYFAHIDWAVAEAARHGLRIAMLPVWGANLITSWTGEPSIFDESSAYSYGEWIGRRHAGKGLVWILGGDTNPLWPRGLYFMDLLDASGLAEHDLTIVDYRPIYDAMAAGLEAGTEGEAFISYHPNPVSYSGTAHPRTSLYLHDRAWLDMNMLQSSHYRNEATTVFPALGSDYTLLGEYNYEAVRAEYESTPTRPVIDGEPRYEGIPVDIAFDPAKGHWTSHDARIAAYEAVFAGAAGHTFGNLSVHLSARGPQDAPNYPIVRYWRDELDTEGAATMRHLKALMLSRPYFTRIPDQSVIVGDCGEASRHIAATRDADGRYAMVYLPQGQPVRVDLSTLSGEQVVAWWYDPRTGTATRTEPSGTEPSGIATYQPPTSGEDQDWVLVLDDADAGLPPPGMSR